MKRVLIWVGSMMVTAAITFVASDYFQGNGNLPEGVVKATLHSDILNEERDIIVHYPPDFDSTNRYPVMFVLDGSSEDKHISNTAAVLTRAGYLPGMIVIGIPNMTAESRQKNLVPPFMHIDAEDSTSAFGGGDAFLEFIAQELIPFVEQKYPVTQERMFAGNSRGGLLVMYSLIRKKDLFSARFCFSTPFWRENNKLVAEISEFLTGIDTLHSFIYMSAGEDETDNIRNGMMEMKKILERDNVNGLVWHAKLTPNAIHQGNSKKSAPGALRLWSEYR